MIDNNDNDRRNMKKHHKNVRDFSLISSHCIGSLGPRLLQWRKAHAWQRWQRWQCRVVFVEIILETAKSNHELD